MCGAGQNRESDIFDSESVLCFESSIQVARTMTRNVVRANRNFQICTYGYRENNASFTKIKVF